ncbi:Ig-like domain-containing protein [Streptomyces sp. NPDC127084]|uniref:DUF7507 domain-containing protein n=1 Tax=Streptomyces sp. NPDC127084 TaxID=3347133 RepID=UPI003653E821
MFVPRPPGLVGRPLAKPRAGEWHRRCWAAVLGTLLVLGPVAAPVATASGTAASAAAAPLLDCSGSTIYALQSGSSASSQGTLLALNASTLEGPSASVTATVVSRIPQGGATNSLGILPGGTGAYVANRTGTPTSLTIHGYDAVSDTWTQYPGTSIGTASVATVAGAINPDTGIYYYGVFAAGVGTAPGKVTLYGFNTVTHTPIPGVIATFDLPVTSTSASNGDFAFDAAGNLIIVASVNNQNNAALGLVRGPLPTTGSTSGVPLPTEVMTTIDNPQFNPYNGIAFDSSGRLYVLYVGTSPNTFLQAINPNNGTAIGPAKVLSDVTFASVDLGACSTNPTLTLQKDITGRFQTSATSNDQFGLSVTGGGITQGNTATTTGSTTGVQSAVVGPIVGVSGTTYTLSESAASGGSLDNYTTTYECVDTAAGDLQLASGSGTSFQLNFPATEPGGSSPRVVCTFTNTPKAAAPALTIDKTAAPTSVTAAGQVVTYTHVLTNTGNVTLTSVHVDETAFSGSGTAPDVTCPGDPLPPGASLTCAANYTVTQDDVDEGGIDNTATATGTPPTGPDVTATANATVTAQAAPALGLVKTATGEELEAGQDLTYSYLVTNTGNVTLSGIRASDTSFSGTGPQPQILCPAAPLAPGTSHTCTATYTATQADVDAGQITNTAVAAATAPGGGAVESNRSTAVVTAEPSPAISLSKVASPGTVTAAGQSVGYSFTVTNSGNVTLTGVGVSETEFSGSGPAPGITCPQNALAPGSSMVCTAGYTVTQGDVDAGSVTNEAVATGTPPSGAAVTATANASVTAQQSPAITLTKAVAANGDDFSAGLVLTYSYLVTNTGNVPLSGIELSDVSFSGTGPVPVPSCPVTLLAPGASMTCGAEYTLTQADVDAGSVTNTARATGSPPTGAAVFEQSTALFTPQENPAVSMTKTASPKTVTAAGQRVDYTFTVTNIGNVPLTGVGVSETDFSGSAPAPEITSPQDSLAPGSSTICRADYSVTQADVDAGSLTNTAVATGTPTQGEEVTSASEVTVTAAWTPGLSFTKSASPGTVTAAGQRVAYAYTVTNTGNLTLTGVGVSETEFSGSGPTPGITCPQNTVPPGDSIVCTAEYTLTQVDVDAGSVTNAARATGTPPTGPALTAESVFLVTAQHNPVISVTKSASPGMVTAAGQRVDYAYTVTNTGNVTLTEVGVSETEFSGSGPDPAVTCPQDPLAPGSSTVCTAVYTVTEADMAAGGVDNTARATGTPPAGDPVTATGTARVTAEEHTRPVITSPSNGSTVTDSTPAFRGTGNPGDTVRLTESGRTLCTTRIPPSGQWTCTVATALLNGPHTIIPSVTDSAGNTIEGEPVTIRIKAVPIAPVITRPANGTVLTGCDTGRPRAGGTGRGGCPVVFGGTGGAGDGITVVEGRKAVCTTTVDDTGEWTCSGRVPGTRGEHTFVAVATDSSGATATSAPVTVTVKPWRRPHHGRPGHGRPRVG